MFLSLWCHLPQDPQWCWVYANPMPLNSQYYELNKPLFFIKPPSLGNFIIIVKKDQCRWKKLRLKNLCKTNKLESSIIKIAAASLLIPNPMFLAIYCIIFFEAENVCCRSTAPIRMPVVGTQCLLYAWILVYEINRPFISCMYKLFLHPSAFSHSIHINFIGLLQLPTMAFSTKTSKMNEKVVFLSPVQYLAHSECLTTTFA